MSYTIIIFTENKPGVLYRIADLFSKRKINIESLTVSETERQGISRFTVVVNGDNAVIEKVVKQVYRIIEVIQVIQKTDKQLVFTEIALIKVSLTTPHAREHITELAQKAEATIKAAGDNVIVVEKSGEEKGIDALYQLLKPFGIQEFVRSGRIAVTKDGK